MHSLFRGEKFTARRTGTPPLDLTRKRSTQCLRATGTLTHVPPDRRTADLGRCRPTFRLEIDAAPAVKEKFPRTAHRNDGELVNKPWIPHTDPGASENPATQRGITTERRKSPPSHP
ncbi:hypothetical protein NDU88_002778 [Pleurodeles waltl]|uniref:Uncharacterized protein n=1 Tax=Pleurodeles waltl TaxID=8319 RepID=A0AAV7T3D2_PLEWA|nr:hypothetical protein NDU88_002778 [Pleurodeles waltl]